LKDQSIPSDQQIIASGTLHNAQHTRSHLSLPFLVFRAPSSPSSALLIKKVKEDTDAKHPPSPRLIPTPHPRLRTTTTDTTTTSEALALPRLSCDKEQAGGAQQQQQQQQQQYKGSSRSKDSKYFKGWTTLGRPEIVIE
jgi:hypothetical protein